MKVLVFKPDEIGDFVLACGCLRLLADELGEENLTLVMKSEIAPLARREFPRAPVIELPLKPRVRGVNKDAVNIYYCSPAWLRLFNTRADAAVCLRSTRDFLQLAFFLSPRARRRIACENLLARPDRVRRRLVEKWAQRLFGTVVLPYPAARSGMPSELEANRIVTEELLGRAVADVEVMPRFATASWQGGDYWLLCPFSSSWSKDYDAVRWGAALKEVAELIPAGGIRLAGGPGQSAALEDFARILREVGVACTVNVEKPAALEIFPDLVSRAALVLTVDTAAAHVACALKAPAVVIACGMHAGSYGPYSTNGRQQWIMGDWTRLGHRHWQESIAKEKVADAIRRAVLSG